MKLQFGILYRDERVADRRDLETLLGEYASWDAETSGERFDGSLLIGYRGDKITCEEDNETQPFSLGPFIITFDGRLDNRDDIAAKISVTADRNLPDPVLILQAYEKYGDAIFSELIGEFAIVLWNRHTRDITFVRSHEGARPLHYILNAGHLIWCSDFAQLIVTAKPDLRINDAYIFEYLVNAPMSDSTPFQSVYAVGAGTVLRFGARSVRQVCRCGSQGIANLLSISLTLNTKNGCMIL